MPTASPVVFVLATALALAQSPSTFDADPPMTCASCEEWNRPQEPFRIFGNTYYVGAAGVSAVLVTSDEGHVLLDGGLSQTAPLIDTNIRALGFRTEDIRLITVSHEHYDHVGGIAALQRASGAEVAAGAPAAEALRQGLPTDEDPQIGFGREANAFPAVPDVRMVADGDVLRVGPLAVTAHRTPGHTPGATTWSWQSCDDAGRCLNMVYVDSLGPISAPGFRFTDDPATVTAYRAGLETLAALPCDIIISVHPAATDLFGRLARRAANADAFIDSGACRAYAADITTRLDERVALEE